MSFDRLRFFCHSFLESALGTRYVLSARVETPQRYVKLRAMAKVAPGSLEMSNRLVNFFARSSHAGQQRKPLEILWLFVQNELDFPVGIVRSAHEGIDRRELEANV